MLRTEDAIIEEIKYLQAENTRTEKQIVSLI